MNAFNEAWLLIKDGTQGAQDEYDSSRLTAVVLDSLQEWTERPDTTRFHAPPDATYSQGRLFELAESFVGQLTREERHRYIAGLTPTKLDRPDDAGSDTGWQRKGLDDSQMKERLEELKHRGFQMMSWYNNWDDAKPYGTVDRRGHNGKTFHEANGLSLNRESGMGLFLRWQSAFKPFGEDYEGSRSGDDEYREWVTDALSSEQTDAGRASDQAIDEGEADAIHDAGMQGWDEEEGEWE